MSSNDWKKLSWGDVAILQYGKSLKDYKFSQGKIPVYGTNGPIGFTDKPLCIFPTVIVGRKGAFRGIHFSKKPFSVIDTAFYLKPKIKELDTTYAYYQLLTQDINGMDSGSAIPSTSREDFYNLKLHLPPIGIQRSIASILSSLDDKIQLNRQTNQTLEAIAQALFKEWFVNFNFPGATGEMQGSELGDIPKGWKVGKLGETYKTTSGGTPSRSKSEYYLNASIPWIKSKELNNSFILKTEEHITESALKNSSAKMLPRHCILIAMYGATVGEIAITSMPSTCNQAICAFLPNQEFPYTFLFNFLMINKIDIIARAVGSAQQNISQELLKKMKIILPSFKLLEEYHIVAKPVFERIESNLQETQTLTQLRDTLLPKLMKGEITIPESEQITATVS